MSFPGVGPRLWDEGSFPIKFTPPRGTQVVEERTDILIKPVICEATLYWSKFPVQLWSIEGSHCILTKIISRILRVTTSQHVFKTSFNNLQIFKKNKRNNNIVMSALHFNGNNGTVIFWKAYTIFIQRLCILLVTVQDQYSRGVFEHLQKSKLQSRAFVLKS